MTNLPMTTEISRPQIKFDSNKLVSSTANTWSNPCFIVYIFRTPIWLLTIRLIFRLRS